MQKLKTRSGLSVCRHILKVRKIKFYLHLLYVANQVYFSICFGCTSVIVRPILRMAAGTIFLIRNM